MENEESTPPTTPPTTLDVVPGDLPAPTGPSTPTPWPVQLTRELLGAVSPEVRTSLIISGFVIASVVLLLKTLSGEPPA